MNEFKTYGLFGLLGGANINKAALPSTLIGMLLDVGTVVTFILF